MTPMRKRFEGEVSLDAFITGTLDGIGRNLNHSRSYRRRSGLSRLRFF